MVAVAKGQAIPIPPLASQLYPPERSTPERHLLVAVLDDVVQIIQRGPGYRDARESPHTYRDAVTWIMAERDAGPFCFVALCEALDFDADLVRTRLLDVEHRKPPLARLR